MIRRLLSLLIFVSLGFAAQQAAATNVWQTLPDIYPGEFASLCVEVSSGLEFASATITVSNATGTVLSGGALPFGTEQRCGALAVTVLPVRMEETPQSVFSTAGTYFVTLELASRTNYFRQVVKSFQNQGDQQAFTNLPEGLILKTILLGGAAECTTTEVHAVQQFLTAAPDAYYATYARGYLASCRLYTELAGNPADPFHIPDPSAAIADLEAIQGAEGLCRGKILFDIGYAYWKKQNFIIAKQSLETVISEYPATPWASAAWEMLGFNLDGLVVWYPLNEGTGLTVTDMVCRASIGQLTGASPPAWVAGIEGHALQFGGSGYVTVPTNTALALATNQLSLAVWVKASSTNSEPIISRTAAGGATGSFALSLTNGVVAFKLFLQGTPTQVVSSNSLPDNLWHHLAGVYDGQTMRLYVDGIAAGEAGATGTVDVVSEPLMLGRNADGVGFVGTLDDVRIFARALSADDVAELFGADTDFDGVSNAQELNVSGTNPANADSDGDGVSDYDEIWLRGTDPNNALSVNITLYANSVIGSNSWDGLSATVTNGHGPKFTIQAAITNSITGDSIQIAGDQAAYFENVLSPGAKSITLRPTGTVTIRP